MRWIGLALFAVGALSFACSGGSTPTPPTQPEPPQATDYLGFVLDEPLASVEAKLPPDAKRATIDGRDTIGVTKEWYGRTWTVSLVLYDGRVGEILHFSDGKASPVEDVRGWAARACSTFAPGAPEVAAWSGDPSARHAVPFRTALDQPFITLGCSAPDGRRFAVAASDAVVAYGASPSVADSTMYSKLAPMRDNFIPFAWSTAPHIGDPIGADGLRYTVNAVRPLQHVGTNPYLRVKATEGALFVRVDYTIENIGNATATILASQLEARDLKGRTFRPSSSATTAVAADENVDLLLTELQPGIPRKQVAVFEVPEEDRARLDLLVNGAVLPLTFRK